MPIFPCKSQSSFLHLRLAQLFPGAIAGATGRAAIVVVVTRAIAGETSDPNRFLLRSVVLFSELHGPSHDLVHFACPSMKELVTIQLRMSIIVCP